MVDRLADDHANARYLAEGLARFPGIKAEPELVQTNILFMSPDGIDGEKLMAGLRQRGVLTSGSAQRIRMVTHYGIERSDIDYALACVREVAASLA
jgi:threonine aldolase